MGRALFWSLIWRKNRVSSYLEATTVSDEPDVRLLIPTSPSNIKDQRWNTPLDDEFGRIKC